MARLGRPIDPYCITNGAAVEVKPDDENPDLRALQGYARRFGARVWRYPDDKLGITSKHYSKVLGREDAPLVFGRDGATVSQTAAEAFSTLFDHSRNLQEITEAAHTIGTQEKAGALNIPEPVDSPLKALEAHGTSVEEAVR